MYNDQKLFQMFVVQEAQAGLSWYTILQRHQEYYDTFYQFDPQKIAARTNKRSYCIMMKTW
ncbi:MAG: DNA-3-methyladenine glycosylase I [Candidatus Chromulinivorax sp.]